MTIYDDLELKKFAVATLRRASYRWPPRTEALKRARIRKGVFECYKCRAELHGKRKGEKATYKIDHILPVIPLSGEVSWGLYLRRMCPPTAAYFQVLCHPCHKEKSALEKKLRKWLSQHEPGRCCK